jgi:hypothetical protein
MADARPNKYRRLAAFIVAGVVLFIIAAVVAWNRWERSSAIDTALSWSLMNSIPTGTKNVEVHQKGSMFSREFVVTFELPADQLEQWLKQSPGTKGVTATVDGLWEIYQIRGSQAQFAEVRVNRKTGQIRIRTYWS